MRYTLSVLTAACLLALGQPAWSDSFDCELQQRARMAVLSLPASACNEAALLLQALHAAPAPAQRHLPLAPISQAMDTALRQHYGSAIQSQQLGTATVELHWSKPPAQDLYARPAMTWDEDVLTQWTQALMATYAETDNKPQNLA